MGVESVRYEVPGWGAGEILVSDGVLLAHDFHFAASREPRPATVSNTAAPAGVERAAFDMAARADEAGLVGCTHRDSSEGLIVAFSSRSTLDRNGCLTPKALAARFTAFLGGEPVGFEDVSIDLEWATAFQRAVAVALRDVPRGEVVTYGELAALAGYPGAARAAGTFCARNRFAFVLPCHRVVGADGIGGYGSAGSTVKRRLLALEGVRL